MEEILSFCHHSPAVTSPPDKRIDLEARSNTTQTNNDTIYNLADLNAESLQSEKVTCMHTRPFKINHVYDETKTVQ